jgi:hypothetical protein
VWDLDDFLCFFIYGAGTYKSYLDDYSVLFLNLNDYLSTFSSSVDSLLLSYC